MSLGPHADFIIAAYAVAFAIVLALIAWVLIDYRRQARLLGELDASGLARRSARRNGKASA